MESFNLVPNKSRQQSASDVGELLRKLEALIGEVESCYLNKSQIQIAVDLHCIASDFYAI